MNKSTILYFAQIVAIGLGALLGIILLLATLKWLWPVWLFAVVIGIAAVVGWMIKTIWDETRG